MSEEITFSCSDYESVREDALEIRNRNRPEPRSMDYLDWRYLAGPAFPSVVFWVEAGGEKAGMAGMAFRTFWVNGERAVFGVLGDISLDRKFRGKGVAARFFAYINSCLEGVPARCAFVMPNKAAEKPLARSGWKTQEPLVRHVYLLDAERRFRKGLKIRSFSKLLGRMARVYIGHRLSRGPDHAYQMEHACRFDASFDRLWEALPKKGCIMGNRGRTFLDWRYKDHPLAGFKIVKFLKDGVLKGYIVYGVNEEKRMCNIYDLISLEPDGVKSMARLFLRELFRNKGADSVCISLNENHIYAGMLKEIGFSRRGPGIVFQTYIPGGKTWDAPLRWSITLGDKDV